MPEFALVMCKKCLKSAVFVGFRLFYSPLAPSKKSPRPVEAGQSGRKEKGNAYRRGLLKNAYRREIVSEMPSCPVVIFLKKFEN